MMMRSFMVFRGIVSLIVLTNATGQEPEELREESMIPLITLDDDAVATNSKVELYVVDDPVMGGESRSESSYVTGEENYITWAGEVVDVPFLAAPGFCALETSRHNELNDVSQADAITIEVRSQTPDYQGFKFSFTSTFTSRPFYSYKSDFYLSSSTDWQTVTIPFDNFTDDWSPYTGNAIIPCSTETPQYCPQEKDLAHLTHIEILAEGINGEFQLDVKGIYASFSQKPSTSLRTE